MGLDELIYLFAIVGVIVVCFVIYFVFIEGVVQGYKDYSYRKTEKYWKENIDTYQASWRYHENFEEMKSFTVDFLRNKGIIK